MNNQRLQQIFENTALATEIEIGEIKSLITEYPYFTLPYVILCKIYFQKEHYKFDNILHHTAIRVKDREWLYHYIRKSDTTLEKPIILTEEVKEIISDNLLESPIEPNKNNEILNHHEVEKTFNNSISDFLNDDKIITEPIEEDNIELLIETIEEPLDLSETNTSTTLENSIIDDNILEESKAINFDLMATIEAINLNAKETEIETEIENTPTEELDIEQIKNLRKHPIYNIEEFLNTENEGKDSATDFFSWLNKPTITTSPSLVEQELETPKHPEKESIIDKFIAINPQISRPKKEFYSAENMAKKSEQMDWDFVTETLANIYYEQGNKEMAIKAYEKLSLQNPMKKTYFASLIQKIKKEK